MTKKKLDLFHYSTKKTNKMKKLITVVILMLAFSINANAQDKKVAVKEVPVKEYAPDVAGKKDAIALAQCVGLSDTQIDDFARLFIMKHETLQIKELSQERKTELSRVMEAKIRGTLNGIQMDKLEANTALFKTLIN